MKRKQKRNEVALKLIRQHLDKIYSDSVEITVAFNSKYITLPMFREMLNKSKLKKNKELGIFVKNFNTAIESLYTCAEEYCQEHDLDNKLPNEVLKLFIGIMKKNL